MLKLLTFKNIIFIIYLVMAILVVANLKELIAALNYLLNMPELTEYERDLLEPQRLIFQIITSALKIVFFGILGTQLLQNKLDQNRTLLIFALISALTFMYFDLPIHECYNGSLESFWDVGRHFH